MRVIALANRVLGVTAAAVFICAFVQSADAQTAQPSIVLVHGAFADGSSWAKVIPILQAKGYNVTAVQNPLTSFADDLAATKRALDLQTGPVVLVGHSWAGVVITEAGIDPKVVGLVYVAAFGPDVGEVVADINKSYPTPASFAAPIVDKSGFMTLSTDAFVKHFASDLPANAAWKTKPSWYIVAKLDEAIAPDEERFFAKRMNATTTELNTSHLPMLSKPADVAAIIMKAATVTQSARKSP
jgi:pimeloyl-ACP methyl ester carboxylesterase